MSVELTQQERDLLTQLVDSALREIGPEIRRTMTYDYKDDLKKQRETLRRLRDRLAADTPAATISEAS
jgi:hypothetical protein